jgi:chromosome segregation ATPase
MCNIRSVLIALMVLTAVMSTAAGAADEDPSARLKEQLRRTQEALRQEQLTNADLLRAKNDAEQKLQAATKQLDALQTEEKGAKAEQSSLHARLSSVEGSKDELSRKLTAAGEQLAAANAKLADSSKELGARTVELAETRQALEQSRADNASCENKNVILYGYSQEILKLYKNKGVWASLAQKDPVLGLKQVQVENVVQEYQLKIDSQKVKPQAQ